MLSLVMVHNPCLFEFKALHYLEFYCDVGLIGALLTMLSDSWNRNSGLNNNNDSEEE